MIFVNNGMVVRGNGMSAQANDLAATSATSFLVAEQFGNSAELSWLLQGWVADETNRRALLVELALIAYKLDQGEYPATLAELTPHYLPGMVTDPYSERLFGYEPKGLEYDLKGDVELPSETPLLWSVGIGNMHLMQALPYEINNGSFPAATGYGGEFGGEFGGGSYSQPAPALDERYEKSEAAKPGKAYFAFEDTEQLLYLPRVERLIFPLPKVEEEARDVSEP
jgi:hypothetical protein